MYFDPLWFLLVAPAMVLAMWAQFRVRSAFERGNQVNTQSGLSGAEVAREILDAHGLSAVAVERSPGGMLSDHYDPRAKVLRLSDEVYEGRTAAAIGVAAHEAGHALQQAHAYAPLALRNGLVPLAMTGSWLSTILIFGGFFLMTLSHGRSEFAQMLVIAGIAAFGVTVLFQIVNLPVEFDASKRAKETLDQLGFVTPQEGVVVASVLNAAAMTYVAATIVAISQLIYFLIRSGILGGRRD